MSALMPNQASHLRKNHISVFLFRRNGLFPELLRAHGRTLWAKGLGGGEHDFFLVEHKSSGGQGWTCGLGADFPYSLCFTTTTTTTTVLLRFTGCALMPLVATSLSQLRRFISSFAPKENVFISNMFKFPSKKIQASFQVKFPPKTRDSWHKNWFHLWGFHLLRFACDAWKM